MKRTLSKAEMLQLWRSARTAEPLRLDCAVARIEATDFDAILLEEMRAWYLNLLDSAPEEFLCPRDVASQARIKGQYGATHVVLPDSVRRVLRVQFSEWPMPVVPAADVATVCRMAANPYTRRPLAAMLSPREIVVCGARGELTSVTAITDPGPETYIFDDKTPIIFPPQQ